jgi:PAS domain S-box-containing protein
VATKQGTLSISLIRDITTRKRTEEALQRSEQLYRTLIDNIHDGVFVIQDGKMQFANEAFATMIGYTVEEVSGKDFRALVAPEDQEIIADRYRRRQAGEDIPRGYEFRMLHKDQTTRVMVDMNAALISSQGKVATMGTVQDITERKRAEEVLQQEAQIAAALARVGRELIASLDASLILERLCQLTTEVLACDCTHVILWQPEQDVYMPVAVYGDTPEQWETLRVTRAPRETVSELLAQIEREEVMQVVTAVHPELLPAVFLRQVGVTAALWVALRQGGEIIGALSAGYRKRTEPFTPQQERIIRGVAQIASLALANAKLVEELTRANQLKSDFLATMSHELRTPLNIAMGYTDLLLAEDFGPLTAEQNEALQRVRKAAHKQLDLVIALLDVSRLEAGQAPVEMREVDMVELMEELRGETEPSVHEKPGLALEWWVAPELRSLYTDRTKLKIVLKNVLSNAVEFTEQGSITVDVRACDGGVEFRVADTGSGIAPEVLPVIFEMFRQGDSSATRRHGGAGLGLYIVRRMLELLGGTIAVESEVGRGSTFRVWVPGGPGK